MWESDLDSSEACLMMEFCGRMLRIVRLCAVFYVGLEVLVECCFTLLFL